VTLEQFTAGTFTRQYQYKSFTPTKLNTEWTWSDAKVNSLLAQANLKLGELNAFSSHIPDIDIFIRMGLHVLRPLLTLLVWMLVLSTLVSMGQRLMYGRKAPASPAGETAGRFQR